MSLPAHFACTLALLAAYPAVALAAKPTVKEALDLKPVQKDVEYDVPDAKEVDKCTIEVETVGGVTGWVVKTSGGQVLRRFLDTNGDNKVDQWCYFQDGLEVYRDIDSNFNNKADQYRWLGTGGTRWGLDEDENSRIDSWKVISAEEVTAEIVAALRDRDAARFQRLLLSADELKTSGLGGKQAAEIADKIQNANKTFGEIAQQQKVVTPTSEWIHFGANKPGIVPAGTDGATKDLIVYDNVTAVVQTPNNAVMVAAKGGQGGAAQGGANANAKHTQVAIGTLIKVGDTWKTFDLPKNLLGDQKDVAVGFFFQPPVINPPEAQVPAGAGNITEEMKNLIEDLEQLDKRLVAAKASDQPRLNVQRADLFEKIIPLSPPNDRETWIKQYAECLATAIQAGGFPEGIRRLQNLLTSVAQQSNPEALVPFVKFRLLMAEYNGDIAQPGANFDQLTTKYQDDLKQFVSTYAKSPDAAEAMLQLAINAEFAGKTDDAISWYTRISKDFPKDDLAPKSIGARRRLESVGKVIPLSGKTLEGKPFDLANAKGKIVLIHYWATWASPCLPDLATIKSLIAKHGKDFSAVGVNLDNDPKAAAQYIRQEQLGWPQLYEQGGLDGSLATNLGVLTLPTMILVGKDGRVINRSINAGELDAELKKLLTR